MNWNDFLRRDKKFLNLGGGPNKHGFPHYEHYVSVNPPGKRQNKVINLETGELVLNCEPNRIRRILHPLKELKAKFQCQWSESDSSILHDIETPFPIPDGTVDRVHSEDCFEHIEETSYPKIFREVYRVLKKGGLFRLAVPDYLNPKDRFCLQEGYDTRNKLHITLTTYKVIRPYCFHDMWEKVEFLHYWEDEQTFVKKSVDYERGYVSRTPDNDPLNTGANPYHVTSLVVDMVK